MEPVTYIAPLWVHNRAIVRVKGQPGTEAVLKRYRAGASRESSTVVLVPLTPEGNPGVIDVTAPVATVEDQYEPTGKIMSILRAPL